MTAAIEQCLTNGERCFMTVGAAHLVGREGVVNLLKKKGYKVKQIVVTTVASNSERSD